MLIAEMLNITSELLNNSTRYSPTNILRRLNLMQLELLQELPPEAIVGLPKYDVVYAPQSPPINSIDLPEDFYFHQSVKGDQTPIKFLTPDTPNTFPYQGTSSEPVIRQEGSKGMFFGRLHDQTVYLSYYRMPCEMKVVGVADLNGVVHTGDNWECELPKNVHWRLCHRAARSFRLTDGDIQEQQGDATK